MISLYKPGDSILGFRARENKHEPTETQMQAEHYDAFARGDLFLV